MSAETRRIRTRYFRAAGLIAVLMLLGGARPILQAARQIVLPLETNPPAGTEFKVKVGETILASRFMDWNMARLDAPVSVSIDRFSQTVGPDLDLEGFGATRGSQERTGLNARNYYCADKVKAHSGLSYQLLSSVTSNVEQFVRFCFVDENDDGRLDHIFLLGAKSRELQVAHAIEPVAFHTLALQPDKKDTELHLILKRLDPASRNILLYQRPRRNGKEPWLGPFSLWSVATGTEYRQEDKVNVRYPPNGPVTLKNIMGYDLTVKSVDPATGEVTFICDRVSEPMLADGEGSEYATIVVYR
jgi:hypothetical protein